MNHLSGLGFDAGFALELAGVCAESGCNRDRICLCCLNDLVVLRERRRAAATELAAIHPP